MTYVPTSTDPILIEVYYDDQDQTNRGWAYRLYDGTPDMRRSNLALAESGPIKGRQTSVRPSRQRILRSVDVADTAHTHIRFV